MPSAEPNPDLCGARTRSGGYCTQRKVTGRPRCKMHGGLSPRGVNHYLVKAGGGRYSKDLPTALAARYRTALRSEGLMSLRDEAALVTVRIGDLVASLDRTAAPEQWKAAQRAFDAFKAAQGAGDIAGARAALATLEPILKAGADSQAIWDQLLDVVEIKRRVSETEARRMKDLHQMISVERMLTLVGAVVAVIRRHVQDEPLLLAIHRDLSEVLDRKGDGDNG